MSNFEWCECNWKPEMEGGRIINPETPWCWYSAKAIRRTGLNTLELWLRKNPNVVTYYDGRKFNPEYECALIRTEEKFGFGTFSCEIKMPDGCNLWPAFWLTGAGNWPPEIDIMEGWSNANESYYRFPLSWKTTTDVHYLNNTMKHEHVKSENVSILKQPKNPKNSFIRYECEWLRDSIVFKVNGKVVRKITGHVCDKLVQNLEHPENGYEMNVVINLLCENPSSHDITLDKPMMVRNFKYTRHEQ